MKGGTYFLKLKKIKKKKKIVSKKIQRKNPVIWTPPVVRAHLEMKNDIYRTKMKVVDCQGDPYAKFDYLESIRTMPL